MADISVQELKERLEKGEKIHLIDVREPFEFEEFNIGSTLIPLGELPSRIAELNELKDQELVMICRSGARSGRAKMLLEDAGFTNVRNLLGGMLTWQEML